MNMIFLVRNVKAILRLKQRSNTRSTLILKDVIRISKAKIYRNPSESSSLLTMASVMTRACDLQHIFTTAISVQSSQCKTLSGRINAKGSILSRIKSTITQLFLLPHSLTSITISNPKEGLLIISQPYLVHAKESTLSQAESYHLSSEVSH